MTTGTTTHNDLDQLVELNLGYVRSVQESDVAWFDQNLASDLVCIRSDGNLLDRHGFLTYIGGSAHFTNLEVHDVTVRIFGEIALIHARTTFTGQNGAPGGSRYTDVWAKRNGEWKAISAQVTRF